MKYRSRPVCIEAIRWIGENNCEEVFTFLGWHHGTDESFHEEIYGIGNDETAQIGDWILLDPNGEYRVMPDGQFTKMFEETAEEFSQYAEESLAIANETFEASAETWPRE